MSSKATSPQSDPKTHDEYHDPETLRDAIEAADPVSLDTEIIQAQMGVTFETLVETLASHDAFVMTHGNTVQPIGLAIDVHSLEDVFNVLDTLGPVGMEQMHYEAAYHEEADMATIYYQF